MKNALKISLILTILFFGLNSMLIPEKKNKNNTLNGNYIVMIFNDTDKNFFFCQNKIYDLHMRVEP